MVDEIQKKLQAELDKFKLVQKGKLLKFLLKIVAAYLSDDSLLN